MENFPDPVKKVLYDRLVGKGPIGLLELDLSGKPVSLYGDLESFGIGDLDLDVAADAQLDFLTGMLNPTAMPVELPFIEMPSGMSTDIHIFAENNRLWVLLIGVDDKSSRQKTVQQKVNDMSLTHHRQSRILNQYLGEEVARRLKIGIDSVDSNGERRRLTMMFADIRGFTTFSENSQPEEVFEALNIYLRAMIPAVIDEHGVIDKIIGDEVMAIFGMLPGRTNGPNHAVLASIRMLQAIDELNRARRKQNLAILQVGIGIATGPVSLGVLGSRHRKSITVIGNHVNLAARLQGVAGPNQLVVDHPTYNSLNFENQNFTKKMVELKGFSAPVAIHLLEFDKASNPEIGNPGCDPNLGNSEG